MADTTPLWLPDDVRINHVYVIGRPRYGKTNFMKTLAIQDMRRGHGVAFLDPHKDAAFELLGNVPRRRLKDVIYYNPASRHAPAFNILRLPYKPTKLADDIIASFKMIVSSWGDRMEHLLRYTLLTLITDPAPRTLKDLRGMLVDEAFRAGVLRNITNEDLRKFWRVEFPKMEKAAINPILNKLSAFLAPGSHLERVFSNPDNEIDFQTILDEQKIFLVPLTKGVLGAQAAYFLGALIVTGLQQAALARARMAKSKRKTFHCYLDEFHNFIVASFEEILTESPKYHFFLTLAHQELGQLTRSPGLERSIFGTVATWVVFNVSADDAAKLCRNMSRKNAVVRIRERNDYYPLKTYLAYMREKLTEEYKRYEEWSKPDENGHYNVLYRNKRDDIGGALATLNSPNVTLEAITEISKKKFGVVEPELRFLCGERGKGEQFFPEMEFKTTTSPNPEDITSLPKYTAYCRIGSAGNVYRFRSVESPPPNDAKREALLITIKKRAEKKRAGRAATQVEAIEDAARQELDEHSQEDPTDVLEYR